MADYLTQDDVSNYGPELIALQAVAPHLENLESQNAQLRQRLAVEARRRLDSQVATAVPNYREIDRDPRWHRWYRWLLSLDPLSGCARQQSAEPGDRRSDANRMIGFFRQFLQENQATGQASGRAGSSDQPIYTRAQVRQLYDQHRRGAYVGREAEWARQDADIIAAGRGRVLGGFDAGGK